MGFVGGKIGVGKRNWTTAVDKESCILYCRATVYVVPKTEDKDVLSWTQIHGCSEARQLPGVPMKLYVILAPEVFVWTSGSPY